MKSGPSNILLRCTIYLTRSNRWQWKMFNRYTLWKVSVFWVFLVHIFPHSDWIWRDTPYLSVFSPNIWKYGPGKLPNTDIFHAVAPAKKDAWNQFHQTWSSCVVFIQPGLIGKLRKNCHEIRSIKYSPCMTCSLNAVQ